MIIGLGGRKGSGKSLLSSQLVNKGFIKISFADHLKNILSKLYSIPISDFYNQDKKEEIVENPWKWNKEKSLQLSKLTDLPILFEKEIDFLSIREMLQIIGTDIIRKYDSNFHVKKLLLSINPNNNYVCDDFRFKNELDALKSYGAFTFFIIRPNNFDISNHLSEVSLKWGDFDYVICNNVPIKSLIRKFDKITSALDKAVSKYANNRYSYNSYAFYNPTKEAAYYAGLLSADSCIKKSGTSQYNYVIDLTSMDYELVEGFKKFIKADKPFYIRTNEDHRKIYNITIHSPLIIENIKHWNLKPRKSGFNEMPSIISDNDDLLKYWFLGLIDGNGSIYIVNNKKYKVIVIAFSASEQIIDFALNYFNNNGINCYKHSEKQIKNLFSLKFYGKNAHALYYMIYDPNFGLNRKWNKITTLLNG